MRQNGQTITIKNSIFFMLLLSSNKISQNKYLFQTVGGHVKDAF